MTTTKLSRHASAAWRMDHDLLTFVLMLFCSAFFAEWDFLICPSYSMAAFPKDESMPMEERTILLDGAPIAYWKSQFWPILTNTAYLPSTTFPAGFGAASKMPIGLNVVGPEYSDLLTIDFARLLKTECGFDFVAPPMAMGNQPKL